MPLLIHGSRFSGVPMNEPHKLTPLFAAVVLALGFGAVRAQEPNTTYAKEYYQAFKGAPANPQDFKRFGPDCDQCVTFDPDGLRINLPRGYAGARPSTGVVTNFGIRGDFEITVGFELLNEPSGKDAGSQTRFTIAVNLDRANPFENQATLNRTVFNGQKPQYFTWMSWWEPEPTKRKMHGEGFPVTAKAARFRLVRTGDQISYLVAERDGEFTLLKTYTYGAEDVRSITLVGSTGGERAALDVRVLDLRIRAASFPVPGPIKPATVPAPAQKTYAQEYFQSFVGSAAQRPGWEFEGPEAESCVKFEPAGLRLTLAQGWTGERQGTGLRSEFGVKGDFEITANYEILGEPGPDDVGKVGTRLSLAIYKDTPKVSVATVSRAVSAKGETILVTWQRVWNDDADKHDPVKANVYPTAAKKGRLRLVRAGSYLYFGAADGVDGEVLFRSRYGFGPEDLREIRIIGSTGGENRALDARVTNLRVRADAIPNKPASSPEPAAGGGAGGGAAEVPTPAPPRRGWLMATVLIGGVIVILVTVVVGAGMFLLRRPIAPAPKQKSPEKAKKGRS
jgi:hypothetical protein